MAPLAMAPRTSSSSSSKPTRRSSRRKPRRTHFKKTKNQEISSGFAAMESSAEVTDEVSTSSASCSTPKGQKFRIPEISSCPPAPKKPRSVLSNCSLRRSPISFYAPPDLEHFFFVALRDIPV